MNKVVTINLNGNAFQLEEGGYETLRAYLEGAQVRLQNDPDRAEIVSDLEQAIADKCRRYLDSHKSVVTAAEIARIVEEMGPVDAPGEEDGGTAGRASHAGASEGARAGAPRRLYQIREGSMISGVCNGLGAYFNIDVSIVRIIFVVLAIITSGGWVLAYILMMFVIPDASTSEERAAARGQPFNAQELVERAKQHYAEFRESSSKWQEQWRRKQEARRARRAAMAQRSRWREPRSQADAGYATRVLAGFMVPVFTLLSAVLFVAAIIAILSLLITGGIFNWVLPHEIPMWAAIVILAIVYQALYTPLRIASRASYESSAGPRYGWLAAADGVMWLGFAVLLFWLAYLFIPEVRHLFHALPPEVRHFFHGLPSEWRHLAVWHF